jgi:predicted alpha/beta-hydrolase family hydrolase
MTWTIPVGSASTTAVYEPADADSHALLVCAHGAGGSMNDRSMLSLTRALRAHGVDVVRFNFLYKEQGSGRPDAMPKLQACFSAVVDRAREELGPRPVFIGGRSMGGRAATMMAADGFDCAGVIPFAYPLHPAGQPEKLRDAHLPLIKVPVLCFCGTRDALCTRELMERALQTVTTSWTQHWIDGADHSFHVLKSSGRTDADVLQDVASTTAEWARSIAKS